MNLQKSYSECGIFSLVTAKKLHLRSSDLIKMHKDNIKGVIANKSVSSKIFHLLTKSNPWCGYKRF